MSAWKKCCIKVSVLFSGPLNFISTQKCKYGLMLLLTKLNLINICEHLPRVALVLQYSVTALHV